MTCTLSVICIPYILQLSLIISVAISPFGLIIDSEIKLACYNFFTFHDKYSLCVSNGFHKGRGLMHWFKS